MAKTKNKAKFDSLEVGDIVKIRNSVYDHFQKAQVVELLSNYVLIDWNGKHYWRHRYDFNTEPVLFCA